jgi:S1-C subfamily serine protease
VLRIAGAPPQFKFPALAFGESAGLRVGSLVVMIGFPFEMPASPSVGFIGGAAMYHSTPLLMTRLGISPGESGAPFLNAKGQVVGVLYGGTAQQPNVAYALPARAAQRVAADLRQFGETRYGSLGMSVQQIQIVTQTNAPPQPAIRIIQVADNTPAAKAGVQPGDLLLSINKRPMQVLTDVAEAMFYLRVGEQAGVQVLHSNQVAQVALTVMPRIAMTAKPQSFVAPAAPADPSTPVFHVQPASATGIKP